MRTNYVLIDFESVQTKSLELLTHDHHFKVIVFVGANQGRLPTEVVVPLQRLGSRAEYVQISGQGPNALDFHIAYYIGRFSVEDPSPYFHIISKDTGFDPLIQHLKLKKIPAGRVETILDIPAVKTLNAKLLQERVGVILSRLQQPKATKPSNVKSLRTAIAAYLQTHLSDDEVALLIQGLSNQGYLKVAGEKVTYSLSTGGQTKPVRPTRQ